MDGVSFFQSIMKGEGVNVSMLATVNTFDINSFTATVKPLVNGEDGEFPLLITVPVAHINYGGFRITSPLKKGDIVLVLFLDRDSDSVIMAGTGGEPNSTREHSLDDAIIIGGISPINSNGDIKEKGLCIQGENNHIILHEDGDIDVKGRNINIDGNVVYKGGSN